ncbi:MAG: hypothetical protein KY055_02485, partial [Candidatus Nealsonbacteria bacterium]|nr:hypothetical protein [Candidatus Nealsonbacteria bacterium]
KTSKKLPYKGEFFYYPSVVRSGDEGKPQRGQTSSTIGDPQTSFSLTKLGKTIALETAKSFRQRKLFK